MYACLVRCGDERERRSSFHPTLEGVRELADRYPGVVAIEEIGVGVIWRRPEPESTERKEP